MILFPEEMRKKESLRKLKKKMTSFAKLVALYFILIPSVQKFFFFSKNFWHNCVDWFSGWVPTLFYKALCLVLWSPIPIVDGNVFLNVVFSSEADLNSLCHEHCKKMYSVRRQLSSGNTLADCNCLHKKIAI